MSTTLKAGLLMATVYALAFGQEPGRKMVRRVPTPPAAVDTTPVPGATPGETRTNAADGQMYVWIPAGTYTMGCAADEPCRTFERPAHEVTLTNGFWLARTEVTVEAFRKYSDRTVQNMPPVPQLVGRVLNPSWQNQKLPMVDVSWESARSYCGWAGGRLPTEAEWEYAARAGTSGPLYGDLNAIAWYVGNSGTKPLTNKGDVNANSLAEDPRTLTANGNMFHEVGLKAPNPWGLFDMLGNVSEWTEDWASGPYKPGQAVDPKGPPSGTVHEVRGGAFEYFPVNVRADAREYGGPPGAYSPYTGFRCAWSGAQPPAGGNLSVVTTRRPGLLGAQDLVAGFATNNNANRPSPLPSSPPQQSLQSLITPQMTPEKIAQLFWDAVLTKCGSDYYYYVNDAFGNFDDDNFFPAGGGWKLTEYKDGALTLKPQPISRPDELNGFQYSGVMRMTSTATRQYVVQSGRWTEWKGSRSLAWLLVKKGGQWHFTVGKPGVPDFDADLAAGNKLACAVIPK